MKVQKNKHKDQFAELFRGPKTIALVSFFLTHPTGRFLQRDIISSTRLAKATASKELSRLEEIGLITVESIGKAKLHRLNREAPYVKHLKRFYNLVSPVVQEFLEPLRPRLVKAILFGSFARGEDREDSDVDILLVGDVPETAAQASARAVLSRHKKTISFIIRAQESYIAMPTKEQVLWNKILAGGETVHGS